MRTTKIDSPGRSQSSYKGTLWLCGWIAFWGLVSVPAHGQEQVYYSDVWEQFNENDGSVTIWGTAVTDDTPGHGTAHAVNASADLRGDNGSNFQQGGGQGYGNVYVTLPSADFDLASYYVNGSHQTDAIVCNGLNTTSSSAVLIEEIRFFNYTLVGESGVWPLNYCDYERCSGFSPCRFISVLKSRMDGNCHLITKGRIKIFTTQPVVRSATCWPVGPFAPIANCFQ